MRGVAPQPFKLQIPAMKGSVLSKERSSSLVKRRLECIFAVKGPVLQRDGFELWNRDRMRDHFYFQ
jgi:hypothetical protein